MGTFDTYHLAWGDASEQVQTKKLDAGMRSWRLGERVPLAEIEPFELHEAVAPSGRDDLPAICKPFLILTDNSSLANAWHNPRLCERHFAFGHLDGSFADYGSAMDEDSAETLAAMMRLAWESHETGDALARQFRLIQARNTQAALSRATTRANIDPTYRKWRKSLVEKTSDPASAKPSKSFLSFLDVYHGPDFSQLSRLSVAQGLDALCSGWERSLLDFGSAIEPASPASPAQDAALACSRAHGWAMSTTGSLGAPSPSSIGALSEPRRLAGPATPRRALELLSRGLWRLYEADAVELSHDAAFVQTSQERIAKFCSSRVGSFWAAGFIARNPLFDFGHVRFGSSDVPLVDWMAVHMGLPTHLLIPLVEAGSPASPHLAHHCLLPHHAALLPFALGRAGGASKVPPWDGASLPVQAARCSSLEALTMAHAEGLLGAHLPDAALAIKEANRAESRFGQTTDSRSNAFPDPLPPALACAVYLHELGLPSRGSMSPRLLACLSMREKESLSRVVGPAPHAAPSHRI